MQLKIQRSQRQGGVVSKSVVFCVNARIFLSAEEQANVSKYKLGGAVIYNSQASRKHLDKADEHGRQGSYFKSLASVAMAALNLIANSRCESCADFRNFRNRQVSFAIRRLPPHGRRLRVGVHGTEISQGAMRNDTSILPQTAPRFARCPADVCKCNYDARRSSSAASACIGTTIVP